MTILVSIAWWQPDFNNQMTYSNLAILWESGIKLQHKLSNSIRVKWCMPREMYGIMYDPQYPTIPGARTPHANAVRIHSWLVAIRGALHVHLCDEWSWRTGTQSHHRWWPAGEGLYCTCNVEFDYWVTVDRDFPLVPLLIANSPNRVGLSFNIALTRWCYSTACSQCCSVTVRLWLL